MKNRILYLIFIVISFGVNGQRSETDEAEPTSERPDKISLLLYCRLIQNAAGVVRVDQNIVPNFRLNKLFRLEVGFRQGEYADNAGAYNGYKVELQTRNFFNDHIRFIARLSDRIVRFPSPTYSNSNYLMIAEGRFPLDNHFTALAALGYVFTYRQDNTLEGWPIANGAPDNYPTYKFGLRYGFNKKKGFAELSYGAYDVFNPYLLSSPFVQATFDYNLSKGCTLYSYFRYQFNETLDVPLNDFLALGVRLHLVKG